MKKFLAIYLGSTSGNMMDKWNAMDEATKKEKEKAGMEAWMKWGTDHASAIVDQGAPLGKTKRIDASGVADTKNAMTGYIIVEAESHEAAAKMFENHPHFTNFPGESIEIMECLAMPTM